MYAFFLGPSFPGCSCYGMVSVRDHEATLSPPRKQQMPLFCVSQGKSHEIQQINLILSSLPQNRSNSSLKPYGGGFRSFQMYI